MTRARPFHKRWHGNALNGMRGLTLEERGAYNTLLDLMYDRQGPWPDDERRTCGELDCDPRVWRRVKDALIQKGKIAVHDGLIYARRVSAELGTSAELPAEVREKFEIATQQLSPKSPEKPKENKPSQNAKSAKNDLLFQSPESIPPKAPKGAAVGQVGKEAVEAIWAITPAGSRKRSGRQDLERALIAASRRGHTPGRVQAGLEAYFASDEATRDAGKFVKGVHRMVEADRWEAFAPPPAAEPELFDAVRPAEESPWRRRVEVFQRNGYWNRLDWGPAPGRPGCAAPNEILTEFGYPTNLLPFTGRPAA